MESASSSTAAAGCSSMPPPRVLSPRRTFQSPAMDSASSTAAAGSSSMPPPRVQLPQLKLAFGNPSPCTAQNTSLEDMVAQLLHVAHNNSHTKVKKVAKRLLERAGKGMTVTDAVALVHIHAPWSKGHGPLHMATAAGRERSCRILIKDFGLRVNSIGTDGATPLVFAIYGSGPKDAVRSTEVVRLLLKSGADPNKAYSNGVAPLHIATIRGNYEVAELLLSEKAEVDPLWEYRTPLYIAAQHGNTRIMELLLRNGATPNALLTYTPLKAAVLGRSKIAVELLIKAGAHVNAGMPETPLIEAATAGSTDIIECLLKAGANANIIDNNGRTPIEVAAIGGWRECVAVLLPVTKRLAKVADWSIDGVIQFACSPPQDLLNEDDVSDFEAEGNVAFSKRDYTHALTLYTMAIEINPDDSTLYAKRSLCFLHTGYRDKALEDAETYNNMIYQKMGREQQL